MKAMRSLLTILLGLALMLSTSLVMAQDRLSFELRGDVAFATQEFGDADLSPGLGVEVMLAYRFMPHLGVYGGWGWKQFSDDNSFAGSDVDFEETGYTFGLQFIHPLGESPINYLVRAGGVYNHMETEDNEGDITGDTGHGLGWQAEVGIDTPLNDYWSLRPTVRYRALSRDINIEAVTTDVELNYISLGVGFARAF